MYFNRDALTIDMGYVNQQRPNLSRDTQRSGSAAPPSLRYRGCQTEKQCKQINDELDNEEQRIQRLREQYSMKEFTRNGYDSLYMIDPSSDSDKSPQVVLSPVMYTLNTAHGSSRINPNFQNNFSPDQEMYTMLPATGNQPITKKELAEKQKFRIYPHMYNQYNVMAQDDARREAEDSALNSNPSMSLGGVNYPIPQYYMLSPLLQQRGCPPGVRAGEGVDYDMRIKPTLVPVPLQMRDNVDLDRPASVVGCGQRSRLTAQPNLAPQHPFGRTAGAPGADRTDAGCAQRTRQAKQNLEILGQQSQLQCSSSRLGIQNDTLAFRNRSPTKSEVKVFRGDGAVSTKFPDSPTYPTQQDSTTGFFELGPAIPPPNPLLLTTLPAAMLMSQQALNAPTDSASALQQRLNEGFEGNPNKELQPLTMMAVSGAIERATGSKFGLSDVRSTKVSTGNTSGAPDRKTPSGFLPSATGTDSTYQAARSSYEKDLQDVISKTISQQSKALKKISDLRHAIAALKQRVVDSRAHNDVFDVVGSDERIQSGLKLIDDLRDLIRAVTDRRGRALSELKRVLTEKEYGNLLTTTSNQVKLMETQVAQYHRQPADDQIECYQQPHFDGEAFTMSKDFYDAPSVGGVGNKQLQSMKIGASVMVKLYSSPNRQGKTLTYIGPRRVTMMPTLWTGAVSGIEVSAKTSPTIDAYDAPFFQGGHVRLTVGRYDYPSVGGVGGGKLASMSLPDGFEVTIYERPGFQGEKIKFLGPQKLAFLPADWNSKVMGIVVELKK